MRTLTVFLFAATFVLGACEPAQPQPDAVAKTYAEAWQKGEYQTMWGLLTDGSQQRVGTEGFTDRLIAPFLRRYSLAGAFLGVTAMTVAVFFTLWWR